MAGGLRGSTDHSLAPLRQKGPGATVMEQDVHSVLSSFRPPGHLALGPLWPHPDPGFRLWYRRLQDGQPRAGTESAALACWFGTGW